MAAKRQNPDLAPQESIGDGTNRESSDEVRRSRIATAAYYKAERRGFSADGQLDDWLAAEQEINLGKSGYDSEQEKAQLLKGGRFRGGRTPGKRGEK